MSTQQGGSEDSGASPAEPAVAEPDTVDPDTVDPDTAAAASAARSADESSSAGPDPGEGSGAGPGADEVSSATPDRDAEIVAAGGAVIGESKIAGHADRSRVRRAPRYKRFAVLGAVAGLVIAAVATPFAQFEESLSPWGLFLLLVSILVPFLILVSCAVAMFTDRAARVPPRKKRKKKARR